MVGIIVKSLDHNVSLSHRFPIRLITLMEQKKPSLNIVFCVQFGAGQ